MTVVHSLDYVTVVLNDSYGDGWVFSAEPCGFIFNGDSLHSKVSELFAFLWRKAAIWDRLSSRLTTGKDPGCAFPAGELLNAGGFSANGVAVDVAFYRRLIVFGRLHESVGLRFRATRDHARFVRRLFVLRWLHRRRSL